MSFLYHLFPPTIHPMVVHFTIAIPYIAILIGFIGLFMRNRELYAKGFLFMLFLSILATIAAGAAGVVSEYYVHVPHPVDHMLEDHKNYGEMTGILLVISFVLQWLFGYRKRKVSVIALIFAILATITVSLAGYVGGSMVYDHGLGVQGSGTTVQTQTSR
jgi:uncharacterized membrane protein